MRRTTKMKMMFRIFIALCFVLLSEEAFSQTDTVRIRTSAQCETCRNKLDRDLGYLKGVQFVELDLESSILTVVFDSERTDSEKIRKTVTRAGYDADEMPADPRAYQRLPGCCKKGGHAKD